MRATKINKKQSKLMTKLYSDNCIYAFIDASSLKVQYVKVIKSKNNQYKNYLD